MTNDMILVLVGALFLVILGMAVGLAVAEQGSRSREHRQARQQAELNAERRHLAAERERLAVGRPWSAADRGR